MSPPSDAAASVTLDPGVPIYLAPDAAPPVLRAAEDLQRDLTRVLGAESPITHDDAILSERTTIVIAGDTVPQPHDLLAGNRMTTPEAHRVFVAESGGHPHLVAHGADMRGTIYAIYTISEHFLGIPPLWIWASWTPEPLARVPIPADTDWPFDAPSVRWRAWFPNDMDYYQPWTRLPASSTEPIDARDAIYETMLRLKLNAVDIGAITNASLTGITSEAQRAADRGLVVLSTHTAPLGTRLDPTRWENYWRGVRELPTPDISLDHEAELFAYWQHSIDTILDAGIETLWTVTLRGHGDVAFWERMTDAPDTVAERAAVIERIVRRQFDLLRERTGGEALARVTMYNEISDYFLDGLLSWPEDPNLIWNFTAARRDHFPPAGLPEVEVPPSQPLGYYMNLQFTSTGSHVAQGEGPWKMEANYRFADALNDEPLAFSIVNAGNIREFVMELSANATMMWDARTYDSNAFLRAFSGTYFGEEHAQAVADLYSAFYGAYWEQRAPDIPGFERQYIFHDLRYARAMRDIIRRLERGETTEQPLGNGFADLSFYLIDPEHTGASGTREAMELGIQAAIPEWEGVVSTAENLLPEIAPPGQRFFEDNILVQARFMLAINRSLHALSIAVSPAVDAGTRHAQVESALAHFREARRALAEAEHGHFSSWYPSDGQRDLFRFDEIELGLNQLVANAEAGAASLAVDILPTADATADWVKVDDFAGGTPGAALASLDGWSVQGDSSAFAIVPDPQDTANSVLFQRGDELEESTFAWKELGVRIDTRGTLFYRQFIEASSPAPDNRQSWQMGLNSAAKAGGTAWWDFTVRSEIDFNQHRAADDRSRASSVQPYAWYNFWFVVDRKEERLEVYRTRGAQNPSREDLLTAGGFREGGNDLSILRLSRGYGGRDWHSYFDDFHVAAGAHLTFPDGVEGRALAYEAAEVMENTGTWEFEGRHHPFRIHVPEAEEKYERAHTVLYLINLPIPRIGTDSDEAIISDMLEEGLVVVEVDAAKLPDTSPDIERALLHFYQAMGTTVPEATAGRVNPDNRFTYWLPSGYRLARNLPFWNIEQHGVHGSLEWIMGTHNRHVVPEHGANPIEHPNQLRGRDGNPLDYNLYLDLMYPSGTPAESVPVIAHFSTLSRRAASFRNGDRPMEPVGWLLDGFALAYVDHIYNPLARHENYGHFEPGYTLESRNGMRAGSAAIRFLRAHADSYHLSDRIGALGHSKSSYTVVRIADPRHPEQDEHQGYEGFPAGSPEPQPWAEVSSRVDAAFASMGSGTRRTQYFSQYMAPVVVAVGRHDHFNHWDVFPRLVAACEEADALHLALWMDELGHDRPFGIDRASGKERNLLIRQFFAQHLHPRGQEDLEVLFMIPRPGQEGVATHGVTRILTTDDELPDTMRGLSPFSPISVRFARSIELDSVTRENLSVREVETGDIVDGFWRPTLQGSRFYFTPETELNAGTRYEIRVTPGVRDLEGRTLAETVSQEFRTAE